MAVMLVPDFILVGHAASVVFAAKNTVRMAALTGRLRHHTLPWGMVVSTKDLAKHYVLRDGFTRDAAGRIVYNNAIEKES